MNSLLDDTIEHAAEKKTTIGRSSPATLVCLLAALVLPIRAHAGVFVATNSTWRYFKGTSEASSPTNAWRELNFDDSAWLSGTAPFHFGTNAVGGDDSQTGGTILSDMRSNYTCIFLRQTFVIQDTNNVQGLWLNAWYDDGFAIWINGQPPRAPVGVGSLAYANTATSTTREANARTRLDISSGFGSLRNGTNVLCVQAFNGHLTNDDFRIDLELAATPPTLNLAAALMTVAEDVGQALVPVLRSGSLGAVTVDFATTNGTAVAGQDYVATNGTLTFAQGQGEQVIAVPILNDGMHELTETFQVKLSNAGAGAVLGATNSATVQITDNDTGFQVEFATYAVNEGAGPVVIGVLRGDDGASSATVECATANGTALAGQDYVATNGTLTFASGERLKLMPVAILNDGVREGQETFSFSLRNPGPGSVLGNPVTATVTLADNDPGVQFEFNQYWVQENEGELRLTVRRGNDVVLGPFTVDFATSNLTASAGQDYIATGGTLSFAEGEVKKTLAVMIINDRVLEPDETFQIVLTNVVGAATLGYSTDTKATAAILDATGMSAHRFQRIAALPDKTVQLTFGGGVSKRFEPYFDLYPIEASTNLVDWAPLVTLQRTNASTNALTYRDAEAATATMRFYRTPAAHFITPFLKPSGPFGVGVLSRLLTDPRRTNRRPFMISIWYPADAKVGISPDTYMDPKIAHDYAVNYVGLGPIGGSIYTGFHTHAQPSVALSTGQTNYPVLLYSHGQVGVRHENSAQAENLASHGYVVVGIDHNGAFASVYPDGTVIYKIDPNTIGFDDPIYATLILVKMQDVQFVLDELETCNQSDAFFQGRLDLGRIGAFGWSLGGATAVQLCANERRCKAIVNLDGGGLRRMSPFNQPMLYVGGGYGDPVTASFWPDHVTLFNQLTKDAYMFRIQNADHMDFANFPWICDPSASSYVPPASAHLRMAALLRTYVLSFFDKYLKGQDDHVLDGPLPGYPEIQNYARK